MEKERHKITNADVPALSQSSVKANTLLHFCKRVLELRVYIKYQLIIMHIRTLPHSLQTAAVPCTPPCGAPLGAFLLQCHCKWCIDSLKRSG